MSHPVGRTKANWFISVGYDPSNPARLAADMLDVVHRCEPQSSLESPFGVKYIVPGRILTPSGQWVNLITVWISEPNQLGPHLVTAYPGRRVFDE